MKFLSIQNVSILWFFILDGYFEIHLNPYLINTANFNNFSGDIRRKKEGILLPFDTENFFWRRPLKENGRDFQGIYGTLLNFRITFFFAIMVDIYNRKMCIEVKDLVGWKEDYGWKISICTIFNDFIEFDEFLLTCFRTVYILNNFIKILNNFFTCVSFWFEYQAQLQLSRILSILHILR